MQRLWIRLSLMFGIVTLTAISITALLVNSQVSTEFRHFVVQNQLTDSNLITLLQDYYTQHGQWDGVAAVFESQSGPGSGRGQRRGAPGLVLADAAGKVVYDRTGEQAGNHLTAQEQEDALPIIAGKQIAGYLAVSLPSHADLSPAGQVFLDQVNRSLLQAGLIAGGLAILLGLVLAQSLATPLSRLAQATHGIAGGKYDQRVAVKGTREIAELGSAFNAMALHLQQAEMLRRNMVADIAHELRTPLSVMQGNLKALLDDVYPLTKAEIAAVYDETLVLNRLINDLRELAQAEAGQLRLNLQPVNLESLIMTTISLFEELAREKGQTLTVAIQLPLPPVLGDPDRIRQVLSNLLANAMRYTPSGKAIRIAITAPVNRAGHPLPADRQVAESTATFVRISIEDRGPGIAPDDLPHVFDRFWRADKARTREYGGSGLGLAIARQLVSAHGGTIGVDSTVGSGSAFWFTLPTSTPVPNLPATQP